MTTLSVSYPSRNDVSVMAIANQLKASVASLWSQYNTWNNARQAQREINRLPSYLIKDMGLEHMVDWKHI